MNAIFILWFLWLYIKTHWVCLCQQSLYDFKIIPYLKYSLHIVCMTQFQTKEYHLKIMNHV